MDNKVDLTKQVFNKTQYKNLINTNFQELGVEDIPTIIDESTSVEDFFSLYDELFYEIPKNGDSNSHEYLIKTSNNYINFDNILEVEQALREEISQLRKELLDEQMKNSKLELNE